jgi:hypothetical protein
MKSQGPGIESRVKNAESSLDLQKQTSPQTRVFFFGLEQWRNFEHQPGPLKEALGAGYGALPAGSEFWLDLRAADRLLKPVFFHRVRLMKRTGWAKSSIFTNFASRVLY